MIFIIILLLMALVVYIQTMSAKKGSLMYIVFFIGLALISGFRYGLGTDFFAYLFFYKINPDNIIGAIQSENHMNIGYRILMSIFKSIGANSDVFIFAVGISVTAAFAYIIYKNSKYKMMSLLVFYAIYYHIYVNSALRQGIALVIFLLAFYSFLKKEKYVKYGICILIASLFHESALITLVFPLIQLVYKKFFYNRVFNGILCVGAVAMFVVKIDSILVTLAGMVGINIPYEASGFSILAVILRLISIAFIYYLYQNCDDNELTDFDRFQMYCYYIGVLIFIAISNVPIFSRLTEYFSVLEVIIYANLIYHVKSKLTKVTVSAFCTLLVCSICIKDLASFTYQGSYENKNVLSYPYTTIFNKEDIFEYREVEEKFIP